MSLDTAGWRRVEAILDKLLDLPEEEREAHLDRVCGDDPELRRDVERMLEACILSEEHFDQPVVRGPGVAEAWAEEAGEEDRDRLAPGDRLGAYRVVELLGRGGMGAVYLAERADGAFDRKVALKVVKRGMDTDEILDRFRTEREILARLQHPHIATLLDGGVTAGGLPFLVMELVEGEPIDRWCDHQQLDVRARLDLFLAVCDAVRYAHRALVVHRDLKPSNILVHEGDVKLLDFGIARILEERAGREDTRLLDRRLTPEYAAPEQIRGEPPTTSADVYALGVILYELLTGERPYRLEGSLLEMERVVSEANPRHPSAAVTRDPITGGDPPEDRARLRSATPVALRQRLRGDLDAIVLRALAKDPARRYGSVEALAEDIQRHLAGRTVRARPDSRWYRVSTFVKRNRTAALLAALAAFGLLGGSVATTIFAVQANQERNWGRLEAERATAARDFVVNLFSELDPDRLQGRTTFTRDELIDLGVQNLDGLEAQPALKASVLNTLGQVAFNLGDGERAEGFFREAYSLLSQVEGEPEVATSMMGIGEVLRRDLDFHEAEEWFRSALASRLETLAPGDPRIAEGRLALAFLLYNRDDLQGAEEIYLELRDSDAQLPLRFRSTVREGLANVRGRQGRFVEAEALYREALMLRREAVGSLDATAGRTLWGLGQSLFYQERLDDAAEAYREALAVHREIYGENHPDVARGFLNLGQPLLGRGELAEAVEAFGEAARRYPEGHPLRAAALHWLGIAAFRGEQFEMAETHFREALEAYLENPASGASTAAVRLILARTLLTRGAFQEAESHLRQALAWQEDHGDEMSAQGVRDVMAELFARTDRPDSAAVYRNRGAGLQEGG
jgi:eukaryotic-like serine/threonine-protein kinase